MYNNSAALRWGIRAVEALLFFQLPVACDRLSRLYTCLLRIEICVQQAWCQLPNVCIGRPLLAVLIAFLYDAASVFV